MENFIFILGGGVVEVWCGGGVVLVLRPIVSRRPRPIGGMPSVGVFLRDPSPYLREFRFILGISIRKVKMCVFFFSFI